jgi:Holliday junction resolvase RusA-like endonuclease
MSTFELPRPPSVNQLYRNVPKVGRVKTTVYKSWLTAAGYLLNAARVDPINGRYVLLIEFGPTRADIGNCEKALSDLLQAHGVVTNDRWAEDIRLTRARDVRPNVVRVTIRPADNDNDTWIPLGDAAVQAIDNAANAMRRRK